MNGVVCRLLGGTLCDWVSALVSADLRMKRHVPPSRSRPRHTHGSSGRLPAGRCGRLPEAHHNRADWARDRAIRRSRLCVPPPDDRFGLPGSVPTDRSVRHRRGRSGCQRGASGWVDAGCPVDERRSLPFVDEVEDGLGRAIRQLQSPFVAVMVRGADVATSLGEVHAAVASTMASNGMDGFMPQVLLLGILGSAGYSGPGGADGN